jgi:hypothetical protein
MCTELLASGGYPIAVKYTISYRRRDRPKRTWRRTIDDEIRNTERSWNEVKGIAGDRNAWKLHKQQKKLTMMCNTKYHRNLLVTCGGDPHLTFQMIVSILYASLKNTSKTSILLLLSEGTCGGNYDKFHAF